MSKEVSQITITKLKFYCLILESLEMYAEFRFFVKATPENLFGEIVDESPWHLTRHVVTL